MKSCQCLDDQRVHTVAQRVIPADIILEISAVELSNGFFKV